MAYEGELVKMDNGRWARFQRCQPAAARIDGEQPILVAVELDDHYQRLLNSAEGALYKQGGHGHLRLAPDDQGKLSVTYSAEAAAVH